jgi:hypothetical protein
VAILERAQGWRPSSARLFSSINAMTVGVDGCKWPRDRKTKIIGLQLDQVEYRVAESVIVAGLL